MNIRKSNQECAELLYETIEPNVWYSRAQILSMAILTADEFTRARKVLLSADVLHFEPTRINTKPAYTLTGKPLATSCPPAKTRAVLQNSDQFEPLLRAWQIRLPSRDILVGHCTNHRFGGDENPSGTDTVQIRMARTRRLWANECS